MFKQGYSAQEVRNGGWEKQMHPQEQLVYCGREGSVSGYADVKLITPEPLINL